MKVFITESIPGGAVQLLEQAGFEVSVSNKEGPLTKEELKSELSRVSYDAVLSLLTNKIDKEVFEISPSVKIYANYAVGFDNLDIEEAQKRGVMITNTPTPLVNEAVAEHTLALLFSLIAHIPQADRFVRDGKFKAWNPNLFIHPEIEGKTIGIVGAGRIGSTVGRVLNHGFHCNILYYDIKRNEQIEADCQARFCENLTELLKQSDVVTLHVPLNQKTHHLIDKESFGLMKKGSYLINTARGGVVDEEALYDALSENLITGAALDVFEHEPEPFSKLLSLSNMIFSPHIGSATVRVREEMTRMATQNIISFLKEGKAITPVF